MKVGDECHNYVKLSVLVIKFKKRMFLFSEYKYESLHTYTVTSKMNCRVLLCKTRQFILLGTVYKNRKIKFMMMKGKVKNRNFPDLVWLTPLNGKNIFFTLKRVKTLKLLIWKMEFIKPTHALNLEYSKYFYPSLTLGHPSIGIRRQSTTDEILIARGFRRESTTEDLMR